MDPNEANEANEANAASFILASSSPQRFRILTELGIEFQAIPSQVDEEACPEKDPRERALKLSRLKAEDVWKDHQDAWILGSDTLVVSESGEILEKPVDEADARRMMEVQSGGVSRVYSGVVLIPPRTGAETDLHLRKANAAEVHEPRLHGVYEGVSQSSLHFRELSPEDIDWWIRLGLWKGRSGSYQIEGPGQLLITRMEGEYSGVVGLPIGLIGELMRKAGGCSPISAFRTQ